MSMGVFRRRRFTWVRGERSQLRKPTLQDYKSVPTLNESRKQLSEGEGALPRAVGAPKSFKSERRLCERHA